MFGVGWGEKIYHIESLSYKTARKIGTDVGEESPGLWMHAVDELQWQQQAAAAECDGKKKAAHARFAKVWRATRVEGRGMVYI